MRRSILLSVFFLLAACVIQSCQPGSSYPPAGSYSNIVLVTESGKVGGINNIIIKQLQHEINYYTKNEIQFKLRMISATELKDEPPTKNMLIYGVVRRGEVGNIIESFIGTKAVRRVLEGKEFIFKREDYPVKGQLTVIVTAPTPRRLGEIAQDNGAIIRDIIEEENRDRLREYLLREEKEDEKDRLRAKYGFEIGMSFLYKINQEREDVPGVEIVRLQPHRGLTVSWTKWERNRLSLADSTKLYNTRAEMAWKMYFKDVMRRDLVGFSNDELGPYDAVRMEGYWEKKDDIYGGPFLCFFIHDKARSRLWIIDMLVYAPGFDKHKFIRELHTLAETFRIL